jgi:hypothetical protein
VVDLPGEGSRAAQTGSTCFFVAASQASATAFEALARVAGSEMMAGEAGLAVALRCTADQPWVRKDFSNNQTIAKRTKTFSNFKSKRFET